MTIKLLLLKSGEDIIADVSEMTMGDEYNPKTPRRIIGYYLNKPCVIKMRDPNLQETEGKEHKAGYSVSLFPWMPLAKDERIPIPADWMITMVEPVTKLEEMYLEDVVNYGQDRKDTSTDESTDSD